MGKMPGLIFTIWGWSMSLSACGAEPLALVDSSLNGRVFALNLAVDQVRADCIEPKLRRLLEVVEQGAIVPYRVKVFKDHPLVKKLFEGASLWIQRDNARDILIPFDDNADSLLLFKTSDDRSYAWFELSAPIVWKDCRY